MEPALRVEHLAVDYGGGPVVYDLDLTVERGEVVALLGPNGSGRTSTLRAIAGIAPISAGDVLLDGVSVARLAIDQRQRAGIFLVPEDRGLFAPFTVGAHMRLATRSRRGSQQGQGALELFPVLSGRLGQVAGSLSGGEAQMLSMAMGIASNPSVLLIDELSFGLAPLVVKQLIDTCRRIATDKHVAVLLVEQYVDLALTIADRGVVLSNGRTVMSGTAETLSAQRTSLQDAYLGGEFASVERNGRSAPR